MALYTTFSLIIPAVVIICRFQLFTKISKTTVGLWGVIVITLAIVFVASIYKYLKKGLPYSYFTQVVSGSLKLPLIFGLSSLALFKIQDDIMLVWQVLGVCAICEEIAVFFNPLPKWANEHNIDTNSNVIELGIDRYFNRQNKK